MGIAPEFGYGNIYYQTIDYLLYIFFNVKKEEEIVRNFVLPVSIYLNLLTREAIWCICFKNIFMKLPLRI